MISQSTPMPMNGNRTMRGRLHSASRVVGPQRRTVRCDSSHISFLSWERNRAALRRNAKPFSRLSTPFPHREPKGETIAVAAGDTT